MKCIAQTCAFHISVCQILVVVQTPTTCNTVSMNEEDLPKSWVGGICINDGKVLLIHRINKNSDLNKEYFVFPGKIVAGDETMESALEKAFKDFSITIKLQDLLFSKEDEVDEQEYYYFCDYVLGDPAIAPGSNEEQEMGEGGQVYTPMWIPLSEVDELIVYPETVKAQMLEIVSLN